MSKHLSKEELQTDPLIDNYNKAASYFNENKTPILAILIGIVVVISSLVGYNFYSANQERAAQELLATAEGYFNLSDYEKALNGDTFELTYGFLGIANDYSGTEAGNLAIYYAAVSSFKLGNVEEALSHLARYNAPEGIIGVSAISFHANLLVTNGSLEKGAETYLKAANWDENTSTTPFNLLKAAEIYYELGNYAKADELTDQILENYPNSADVVDTEKLKGMISVAS